MLMVAKARIIPSRCLNGEKFMVAFAVRSKDARFSQSATRMVRVSVPRQGTDYMMKLIIVLCVRIINGTLI